MAQSPLHRHEEWKAETAELHQLLATAQQRLSMSPRGVGSPVSPTAVDGTPGRDAAHESPYSFSPAPSLAPAIQPSFTSRLPTERDAPEMASTFVDDMRGALKHPELCDAVIVAKDGKEVLGVRAVLACRSSHFEKLLLDASPSSGARAVIEMPEHSQAALQAVVDYLVTDELSVPAQESDEAASRTEWGTWVEIVSIAAQWQLARMENLALDKIAESLNEVNCIEILIESTHFNLQKLKKDCVSYIVGHKEEVRKRRSWQELTKYPDILLEVSLAL
jgi:hypothetical protein